MLPEEWQKDFREGSPEQRLEADLTDPLATWVANEEKLAKAALKPAVVDYIGKHQRMAEPMQVFAPVSDVTVATDLEADNWRGYNDAYEELPTQCQADADKAKAAYKEAVDPKKDAKATVLNIYAKAYAGSPLEVASSGGDQKMQNAVKHYTTMRGKSTSEKASCCKVKTKAGILIPKSEEYDYIQPIRVPNNFDMSDCIDVASYNEPLFGRCDLFNPAQCLTCRQALCGATKGKGILTAGQMAVCNDKVGQV